MLSTPCDPDGVVVYYDGACPLCRAEIGLYAKQEGAGALRLVDVSTPGVEAPEGLDRATALARFHVRARDGRLLSGAAAFAELWSALPRWRRLGRLAALPGIAAALELAYRGFLVLRPALVRAFVALRGGR